QADDVSEAGSALGLSANEKYDCSAEVLGTTSSGEKGVPSLPARPASAADPNPLQKSVTKTFSVNY
ncbi:MAG: hypothetical protein QMC27_04705, partial [Flavobacteriaceae bacterium]